jgi:hypothetical protein
MDNLGAHKGDRVRAALPATLLAGPQPYRGGVLQGQGAATASRARAREALVEVIGRSLDAVTSRATRAIAYYLPDQPL